MRKVRAALERLVQTHAFVLQETEELWRAASFFCRARGLSGSSRQAGLVWQLHLGCPGNSGHAAPERAD
jgi:hypothetical protein